MRTFDTGADGKTWELVSIPSGGTNINALHADADGGMWVAERGTRPMAPPLCRWHAGTWQLLPLPQRPRWFLHIESLATDRAGALWAGSRQFGLYRWDGAGWTRTVGTTDLRRAGLPGSGINGLAVDPRGRVWAATHGGIGVYADGVWRSVGVAVDAVGALAAWVPMRMPTCLHLDEQGRLWVGTLYGQVVWVDTSSDEVIVDADAFIHVYQPPARPYPPSRSTS